ncbi:zinc finger protein 354A-like isoform X1 [Plodia interpunctella]|uniref:zinc finger protein 354A-like isoform X1 n=1 Tax=Plodia interpunctella TaxID=58824 RepID=UPI002367AF4E|nr:zinc finger protein 354A-like isoform X1 [Plodia interpunctella]XP_053613816.1 zinc finger protein 354A-like isoform X1 [Plodia interpunctella]
MMFDPPDFPYKDLGDTLGEHYAQDDLMFNCNDQMNDMNKELVTVTEEMISNVENQLIFQSNDAGRYFNMDSSPTLPKNTNISNQNTSLYIVQPDHILNFEPTLLDENTVNQFLLPAQSSSNKDAVSNEPNLLALHSCVICHEIFTSDADLLDHTISYHATRSTDSTDQNDILLPNEGGTATLTGSNDEPKTSNLDFESDWLVCSICERVLSTALEVEPTEQLCCNDGSGKSSVSSRKLLTMYVCEFCSGLFADGEALDRHRLSCYNAEDQNYYLEELAIADAANSSPPPGLAYNCACGKQYPTPEELKIHTAQGQCQKPVTRNVRRTYSTANSNKMWNCGSCNQLFATARELYRHKRGEDRSPGAPLMAYVCEECDKVLGSMCALHTHKKMHKVSKPGYPCRICGRRFNQSGHLAIHMRMHTGERPYPCDLCPKAFKVKVERDDHRRTHTGERPFACSACSKTFTAAARLREHARIHTDQRPYRCEICGAAFRRPYARTVHTLIHTGEKPHECDVCGTAFRRSGDMWKHKRTLHGVPAGTDSEYRKT